MLSCKETSVLVSKALDERLALHERLAMRLHLVICRACQRFEQQARFLRRAAHELGREGIVPVQLSAQGRERIRNTLARER